MAAPAETLPAAMPPRAPSPLRDLVVTWYEARGYRPIPALPSERPIECVFRHKADPLRAYAFAVIAEPVTRERALALLQIAQAAQAPRLLLACEQAVDAQLAATLARDGVRAFDQAGIDSEIASTDAEAAQRIRALAQRRSQRPVAAVAAPQ